MTRFTRILIAIDNSKPAKWAMQVGRQLAVRMNARVLLVTVVDPIPPIGKEYANEDFYLIRQQQADDLLETTRLSFPESPEIACDKRVGSPEFEVVQAAREWQGDFVVIGTHDRGRLSHFVLGGTADEIIRTSPCPVITVAHEPLLENENEEEWVDLGADSVAPLSAHVKHADT